MNILKAIFNIPLLILQVIAFLLSLMVCNLIHFILKMLLEAGSWLIVQNALLSHRLMAFALNMSFEDFNREVMQKIRDRQDDSR